jgi:UDP-N-acetylglucosamine 2-epimerase (non-hydrolysing)
VLAGAAAASKLLIAVGHVEAGLRSYDKTMPEEINRQMADVCSMMFFVPTEESAINLLFENIDPHGIYITGNTVVDACIRHLEIAKRQSKIFSDLDIHGDILTLTMHRAENVDDPERLKNITEALLEIDDLTVIFPVHPRTVKTLKKFGLYDKLENASHIKLTKPIGYLDFLLLLSKSKFIMTDSGGIQEEAITMNVPCITLRYNTERPETVSAGGNILVGAEKSRILNVYNEISEDPKIYQRMKNAKNPYGDGNSGKYILKAVSNTFDEGKLEIKSPDHIKGYVGRKLIKIQDHVTVSEYEKINHGSTVMMVFQEDTPEFPYPDLNLKNKMVLLNISQIE